MNSNRRLILGISGASGIVYGIRFLEIMDQMPIETHLVMSQSAEVTLPYESNYKLSEIKSKADIVHANKDIGASISSG